MSRVRGAHRPSIGAFVEAVREEALWPGAVLLIGGSAGTVAAHATATWTGDPSSGASILRTAALVVASLMAIAVGAEIVVSAERSPMRHVFVSDSLRRTAATLVAVAIVLVASFLLLGCFGDLFVQSQVTARVVAGMGMLGSAVALVVIAVFARWLAARSRNEERDEL